MSEQHSQNPSATGKTTLNKQPSVPRRVYTGFYRQHRLDTFLHQSPLTTPRPTGCPPHRRALKLSVEPSQSWLGDPKRTFKKFLERFSMSVKFVLLGEPESFKGQVVSFYRSLLLSSFVDLCCSNN